MATILDRRETRIESLKQKKAYTAFSLPLQFQADARAASGSLTKSA